MISPRDLARKAFWSDHPLSQIYALAHGRWRDRTFVPAQEWSLQQLIAFAEALPEDVIRGLTDDE